MFVFWRSCYSGCILKCRPFRNTNRFLFRKYETLKGWETWCVQPFRIELDWRQNVTFVFFFHSLIHSLPKSQNDIHRIEAGSLLSLKYSSGVLCTGHVYLTMLYMILYTIWPFYFSNLNAQWKLEPSRIKPHNLKGQQMKTSSINMELSKESWPRKKSNFIFQKLPEL